jgi:hypothetical protein
VSELIEQVAQAICVGLGWLWDDPWHTTGDTQERCRTAARAAIEALREPTEEIYLARPVSIHDREDWAKLWRGAIDAALMRDAAK